MDAELSTIIIKALLSIAIVIFGLFTEALRKWIKRQAGENGLKIAEILARNAVGAVEQIFKNKDIHGEEKLKNAVSLFVSAAENNGIKLDRIQIEMMIEAAVQKMNQEIVQKGN